MNNEIAYHLIKEIKKPKKKTKEQKLKEIFITKSYIKPS